MRANGNRRHDEGTATVVGLIIGIVVFSLVFAYMVSVTLEKRVETANSDVDNHQAQANSLADILFGTGSGWYGANPCTASRTLNTAAYDPEAFSDVSIASPTQRFGLGDESCERSRTEAATTNNLSFAKISNLFGAQTKADPNNDHVDYEEARHSLGLDATNLNFHLRSGPVLSSVVDVLRHGTRDTTLRPLYMGDYEASITAPSSPNIAHAGTAEQDANYIYLNVTITQVLPTVTSSFQVAYEIPLSEGTISFTKNTISISSGSVVVSAQLSKTKDWAWANPSNKVANYEISDPFGAIASGTISMSSISPQSPLNNQNNVVVTLSMDRLVYNSPFSGSNWPVADYAAYDGTGKNKASFDGDDIDLKVVGTGLIPYTKLYSDPDKNGQSLQDILLIVGSYRVEAWISNSVTGKKLTTDSFEVVALGAGADACNVDVGDYTPAASVGAESGYVSLLFADYQQNVALANFDTPAFPYAATGDVFPDVKCALNQHLAGLLTDASGSPSTDRYTTLIVGSNVDHNAMTSGAAKNTIRDWVLDGGTLIVFGSDDQSVQWLQPLFHAALDSAGGGLYTPDENHPVLSVPNDLDYSAYEYQTQWEYGAGAEDLFTHVVTTGGQADVLALSDPGAFGEGKVLLTSWRPYDLTPDQATVCPEPITEESRCQALFMLHNLVTQSYRELFLDFGPALPLTSPVSVSTRIVSTYHPELKQLIGLEVQVFVFPGS
jgi:hypothetical protein